MKLAHAISLRRFSNGAEDLGSHNFLLCVKNLIKNMCLLYICYNGEKAFLLQVIDFACAIDALPATCKTLRFLCFCLDIPVVLIQYRSHSLWISSRFL